MILQLNASQVLLNKLYIPIPKGNIATMVKSKEAKEFTKYVHIECIRQKIKPIKGQYFSTWIYLFQKEETMI